MAELLLLVYLYILRSITLVRSSHFRLMQTDMNHSIMTVVDRTFRYSSEMGKIAT